MTDKLKELAQDAVYEMRHLSTDTEHGLSQDLQVAINNARSSIAMTAEFMHAAGQEVKESPGQPTVNVLKLRLTLELEELYEKAQAFGLEGTFQDMLLDKSTAWLGREGENPTGKDTNFYNAVEVLDAAADQRVVADGTILACGLQHIFPAAMAEVHASNLSKFPETELLAQQTVSSYERYSIYAKYYPVKGSSRFVVKRSADLKVLKSLNYSPANLAPLLAVS